MFFRLCLYSMKRLLREKELLFWNLCFPLILGTLFAVTFGGNMENSEIFHSIKAAYIEEEADDSFVEVLKELSKGDNALLDAVPMEYEEAKRQLKGGEIKGIFENKDGEVSLVVKEQGISQSILKLVAQQYTQRKEALMEIGSRHPENLEKVIGKIRKNVDILQEKSFTDGNMDVMNGYFYALIAMTCLYGCFGGIKCACDNKADLSALAARRNIASTNRFLVLAADLVVYLLQVFMSTMIAVVYLKYVMKVSFGSQIPQMMLVTLVGSFVGIAMGFFIGTFPKMKEDSKLGLAVGLTMLECFLGGLMVGSMYHIIHAICPLLNKINPAALIVDALYSLDIYSNYSRYSENLVILTGIALLLCICGYLNVRRERYASI